jgi:hypothetical protein
LLAGVVSATLGACFGADADDDGCEGASGCACFANDTCNAGLMCSGSVCVAGGQSGASGGGGSGGQSGGQSGSSGSTPTGGTAGIAGTAAGGSAGGGAVGNVGGTSGSAGMVNDSGASGMPGDAGGAGGADPCGNLVDDMEDADNTTCIGNARWGAWFAYDNMGDLPPPEPTLLDFAREDSILGMHFAGDDSPAGIGFTFSFYLQWNYDASAYTGLRFYARAASNTTILARFHCMDTTADEWGGTCTTEPESLCTPNDADVDLTTDWTLKTIPFTYPSGGISDFDKDEAVSVTFYAPSGSYDFWIDDVTLY